MKINQQIAQKIVKRAMQIIPYSVNVMDEKGIIIASGDPNRLQQLHSGAVMALRKNQAIEIDESLVTVWKNAVKIGINLPITYMGSNVGVVGISGQPNEVRHYTEFVKMTAELIIEQSALLEKERWDRRYKEEFVRQLISGSLAHQQITQQASFFNLDPNSAFAVIIIKLTHPIAENLQQLIAHLEHYYPHLATAVIDLDKVILLRPLEQISFLRKPKQLSQYLPNDCRLTYKIAIGCLVKTLYQAPVSYQTALQSLHYGETFRPKKQVLFFDDDKLPALLGEFGQSWQAEQLLEPIYTLHRLDDKQQLFKTLQSYFLANCDLDHAAQTLFIHPNTLRYRLAKIEQLTTLSFNKIEQKFRGCPR
ncbi:hypothetical protein A4G19_09225 [Pasteurellaceae bacterium Macca]|nr:hypothetical protein [Pasteurellaceae bacterium Macca]